MLTDEDKECIKATISAALGETVGAMIEASENRLLTAFHRWASPIELRQRTHAATLKLWIPKWNTWPTESPS